MGNLFNPEPSDAGAAWVTSELGLPPLWTFCGQTPKAVERTAATAESAPVALNGPQREASGGGDHYSRLGEIPVDVLDAAIADDADEVPLIEWLADNDEDYIHLEDLLEEAETQRFDHELAMKLCDQLDEFRRRIIEEYRASRQPGASSQPETPPLSGNAAAEKALNAPPREQAAGRLSTPPADFSGPLTEKYRPRTLDGVFGQSRVVAFLRKFARAPYPAAFLFEGETGTGKTSAAFALAAEIGCDIDADAFGGVNVVASGEQSADGVREICNRMWTIPPRGSGWKVVIVNEADKMTSQAEVVWLDRLEDLPPRTVVVFTTNYHAKLSQRFRDRCLCLGFTADAGELRDAAREFASAVFKAETGTDVPDELVSEAIRRAKKNSLLSFRRLAQVCQVMLSERAA